MTSISKGLNTKNVNPVEPRTLRTQRSGGNGNVKGRHLSPSKALPYDLGLPQIILTRIFQVGAMELVPRKNHRRSDTSLNTNIFTYQLFRVLSHTKTVRVC